MRWSLVTYAAGSANYPTWLLRVSAGASKINTVIQGALEVFRLYFYLSQLLIVTSHFTDSEWIVTCLTRHWESILGPLHEHA